MRLAAAATAGLVMTAVGAPAAGAAVGVGHSGWFWGDPRPQGLDLFDLDAAGPRLYATGAFGTVLRSDHAGGEGGLQRRL